MERDPVKDILVSNDINEDIIKQSAIFYYWGGQLADALLAHSKAKTFMDKTYASREKYWRTKLNAEKDVKSKVTDSAIKAEVETDEIYQSAVRSYHESKYKVDLLYVVKDALKYKRESLSDMVKLILNKLHGDVPLPRVNDQGLLDKLAVQLRQEAIKKKSVVKKRFVFKRKEVK